MSKVELPLGHTTPAMLDPGAHAMFGMHWKA